jgi:hypothetical protein
VPDFRNSLCVVLFAGLALGHSLASADSAEEKFWRFQVYVNDKPVGLHEFRLQQRGGQQWLNSSAEFEYTLLSVPLYRYQHQNQEIWQDGCLARIESSTDANGKDYAVYGEAGSAGFKLDSSKGEAVLPGCVQTFAYWNPDFLQASQLLNTQNGEYLDVAISDPVKETIEVLGQSVMAQRYQLTAKKLKLDLWYSDAGEWLALQSVYDNGRTLRYELINEPTVAADSGSGL